MADKHVEVIVLAAIIILAFMLLYWLWTLSRLVFDSDLPARWNLDQAHDETPAPPVSCPPLSILIPARNEEKNISSAVESALQIEWHGPLEVIVVDDRSSDGTRRILHQLMAADARLSVIDGRDPPNGWLGKPHALHLGQAAASGELLLFIDADVRLTRRGVLNTYIRMTDESSDMVSVLGRLETLSFFEHVVQPRLGALLAGGNPLNSVNDPEDERVLANGQFLLFTRRSYDEIGGHESICDSVLDDVDLATRTQNLGLKYTLFYGQTVFSCRMYQGIDEIWSGWSKNLFPGMRYNLIATLILSLLVFTWCCVPFLYLALRIGSDQFSSSNHSDVLLIAVITTIFLTDLIGHRVRGYRWHYFWTFPLGMFIICLLFLNSAFRISFGLGADWKGRSVETKKQRDKRNERKESESKVQ